MESLKEKIEQIEKDIERIEEATKPSLAMEILKELKLIAGRWKIATIMLSAMLVASWVALWLIMR